MGITNSKSVDIKHVQSNISQCTLNNERIEPFNLIWLDENALTNSFDTLRMQTLFLEINNNNNCLFFDRSEYFLAEIEKLIQENRKLLVIMSGSFAKEILSKINDPIFTIIIFCQNYNKYINLLNQYYNIVNICTDQENLKSCIQNELLPLKFNLLNNQILKSIQSLTFDHDRTYFSYMLFIELLKQIPPTKQAKDLMLNKCKDYYRDNLELIEQFRNSYTSNQAIDWYIRECFVYRLVNRAFQTEDIVLWYLFRYFILDLCRQLECVHKEQNIKSLLTVYCCQTHMTINEFENIKSNIGCLISTNGFLSTSTNIHLAKEFIDGAIDSENFKVVIFEIIVDGSNLENTIFVDIDQYTKLTGENKILFNIGSIFKIENVDYDVNIKAWIIKMKATDEGTHEIKARIDTKKREFHQENINLMFGRLLLDMNEYTKAESYFQMMLRILPKSHEDLSLVYDHIGDLNMKTSNWNAALTNFNLAYEIKKKILPIDHPLLGTTFNNLGNYYKAIGDYMKALEYYKKALQCQNDRFNMARIQLNIDAIYGITNDHNKALNLCIESRDLLQQIHPCSYNEIIQYQCLIGNIYSNQKNYQIAVDYYLTAFEMSKQILLINDRIRIDCIKSLVELYYHRNMKQLALDFCFEQLSFYEKYLHENHLNIAYLTMKIGELYDDERKLLFLQKALRMFEKSVQIEYATTGNCLMMIAEYYQKQNLYQQALKYYIRALEIRKKIYPKDHSMVIEIQSIIDTKILSKEL